MRKVKVAQVGLGHRGYGLLKDIILDNPKCEVVAVCDLYDDRTKAGQDIVKEKQGNVPFGSVNHMDIVTHPEVELVVITSGWESHIPVAISAMENGKMVAMEVGGAYTIEQCWDLVKCYEKTKVPFMFLENCCYGKRELMVLNMVKQGLFGKIVHCAGGYHHDLRKEITFGKENRHYRLGNYLNRNCENYPTHELGPIARVLNINHGNRMLSLASTASLAAGLSDYVKEKKPNDTELMNATFNQGDVVTTVIKCAGGETITLTLDTSLPRCYTRGFTVNGTKGMYQEEIDAVFIDGMEKEHSCWKPLWGNAEKYEEEYMHPIWKDYIKSGVQGTHDGMDWLQFDRMFDCILEGREMEIDVYDAASWMCITALSEKSIALGSIPVEIPDFTNGYWTMR